MITAILLAAGHGTRSAFPQKQYALVGGKPLLWYSLRMLSGHPRIEKVMVSIPVGDGEKIKQWVEDWGLNKVEWSEGGTTRQASAMAAFEKLNPASTDVVVFHNAANPFVSEEEITAVIEGALEVGAAFVAHPAQDTLKHVKGGRVVETIDRSEVWQAQTPQAVRADLYKGAHYIGVEGTDEMSMIEAMGHQPMVVLASPNNIKITTPRDMEFARFMIEGGASVTGMGQDSHRFDRAHKGLVLGGVRLPAEPAMEAISDGDVMIHSLCNALLQTMGAGSLGSVADAMAAEGITDSANYLAQILSLMNKRKLMITHVGFQLEGAHPRIDPLTGQLKERLSGLLNITPEQIGITATSGEDLTSFGRGEGLQCFATVTVRPVPYFSEGL